MGADPALDGGLEIVGQGLVGAIEIAEAGLAACRRHLDGVEDAADRRLVEIGHVDVPLGLVVAERADRLPVLDDVGDDQHVGVLVLADVGGAHRRLVEPAEALAEGGELVLVQLLAAEAQHLVRHPGLLDRGEGRVVERAAEVHALDVSARVLLG